MILRGPIDYKTSAAFIAGALLFSHLQKVLVFCFQILSHLELIHFVCDMT